MKSKKNPKRDKTNMFFDKKNNRISTTGFTLIEIMVVVAIIVLIASVTIIAINRARARTRDAVIIATMEQLEGIAETTYNPQDGYRQFSLMVGDTRSRDDDHKQIREIRDKIEEMGINTFRVWFPEDGQTGAGWNKYCAYAEPLYFAKDKAICIDSSGAKMVLEKSEVRCSVDLDPKIYCTED